MIVRPTQELKIIVLFNIFDKIQINLIQQNWKLDSNADLSLPFLKWRTILGGGGGWNGVHLRA